MGLYSCSYAFFWHRVWSNSPTHSRADMYASVLFQLPSFWHLLTMIPPGTGSSCPRSRSSKPFAQLYLWNVQQGMVSFAGWKCQTEGPVFNVRYGLSSDVGPSYFVRCHVVRGVKRVRAFNGGDALRNRIRPIQTQYRAALNLVGGVHAIPVASSLTRIPVRQIVNKTLFHQVRFARANPSM